MIKAVRWALGGVMAALMTAPAAAQESASEEEIVVTGRRVSEATIAIGADQTRNTISITREALLSAPAGISGLKMLESLPGFNVQANDALGLYEFGNSVFVRAFNFQQIGFLLDGVPMGRSDQFGGSPIFRYVDNENLLRVTASQGAGGVSLPSYASLGPIVQYFTVSPSLEPGVAIAQTIGSDELSRSFVRLESGEWNGFSAYLSRSQIDSNLWRGPGTIDREHIEGKIRFANDAGYELTLQGVYNDFFDFDTPSITRAQYEGRAGDAFGRRGREFGYLPYVPDLPATTAGVPFSNTLHNQYYLQAVNQRSDTLLALSGLAPLSDAITLRSTIYYENKDGYGVSPEAYATSLTSHNAQRLVVPGLTAPRGLQYGLSTVEGERRGFVGGVEIDAGAHRIQAGVWLETDDYRRTQARYNQAGGNPAGAPLLNEPVHLQRDYTSVRDTVQFYLSDTISLFDDRLRIELGAKGLQVDYAIQGYRNPGDYIANRQPRLTDIYEDWFLPQAGFVFNITGTEQIFGSYAENLALPRGADDIFSAASPAAPGPDAETATNYEIGIRTNRPTFNGAISIYKTTFDNRLQSFAAVVPGSTTTETFFQNVGGVESTGVELSGIWEPAAFDDRVYLNVNASYNVVEFQDGYSTLRLAGNTVPDSPEWTVQGGVTIEPTAWAVFNLSARYVGERFTNFVNSETVDGYTVLNAYLDLGGDGVSEGPFQYVRVRFNVDNLTDEDYLGTINVGTTGLASFRPGPARTYQLTVSADF